jgi:hypothetical protein
VREGIWFTSCVCPQLCRISEFSSRQPCICQLATVFCSKGTNRRRRMWSPPPLALHSHSSIFTFQGLPFRLRCRRLTDSAIVSAYSVYVQKCDTALDAIAYSMLPGYRHLGGTAQITNAVYSQYLAENDPLFWNPPQSNRVIQTQQQPYMPPNALRRHPRPTRPHLP